MITTTPIELPECHNPKVPAPEHHFYHMLDLQIRFNDIDILGHINNSVYLSFMDLGKAEYMEQALGQQMKIGKVAVAIVNINSSFYSPAYFNEPLRVVTAITRITDRSLTMYQRIYNPLTGDVKCIAQSILSGFDPVKAVSASIPADVIARAEAHEQRALYHPHTH